MNTVSRILLDMHDNLAGLSERQKQALHDGAWLAEYAAHASMDSWGEAVASLRFLKDRIKWSENNLAEKVLDSAKGL